MDESKGNILIVDDSLESLQLLSNTLSQQGYKIRGAAKGTMAIRTARSSPPDLILLDIKMPGMDGYTVCRELKEAPETPEIPVIFISALDEVIDKVKAFKVGGVDYITKPFQVEEVLARIEHQLTIKRLQKQLKNQNNQLQKEIIERKKAEEAAESASQAKSQFLANMSHELRTPLNAILGFTQVLRRDPDRSFEQQEYLRIIERSGDHLLELIDDVLDLSKIEAGLMNFNPRTIDLYRLLDNLEELFQIRADQKDLELRFTVSPDVPQYIKIDAQKLRGCLINLVGNAIKFTSYGSVVLQVRPMEQTARGSRLKLLFSVRDTGPGIASSEMDGLFDAFVQTSSGVKSAEGTGLGLTITQKFAQIMGGDITVESVVGQGTTFDLQLEADRADGLQIASRLTRRVAQLKPDRKTYRILIVDDTEENRLLLLKLLEPIGFQVKEAAHGREGIEVWQHWQPDLIWMDTRMPVMGGLEATQEIRAREEARGEKGKTIIIALTASAFEERRGEILAAGSDDFIRKPFTEDLLFEKMSEHLGVTYIYEEMPRSLTDSGIGRLAIAKRPDSFWQEQFIGIPPTWVMKLQQAASEVNEQAVCQLLSEIPPERETLAQMLQALAEDFRLDIILHATEVFLGNSDVREDE